MKKYEIGKIIEYQEMTIEEIIQDLGTFINYYAETQNRIPVCMEQAIIKLRELEEIYAKKKKNNIHKT